VYLVDTNIISAAAPSRKAPPALVEWLDTHSASLFVSAVTMAEIEDGIAKSRREGATRKSADLAAWLETLLHLYGDRVLAFDAANRADRGRDLGSGAGPGPGTGVRGHHYRCDRPTSWTDHIVAQPQAF